MSATRTSSAREARSSVGIMLSRTQWPALRGRCQPVTARAVGGERVGTGEALVGVQVEADVAAPRDRDEAVEVGDRVVREMRCPADQVDARVERGVEHRVRYGRSAEGHELDVHAPRSSSRRPHRGADADQRVLAAEQVDVRPDGGDPGCQHPHRRGARPVERLVLVEVLGEGLPALDRAHEVAERGLDGITTTATCRGAHAAPHRPP